MAVVIKQEPNQETKHWKIIRLQREIVDITGEQEFVKQDTDGMVQEIIWQYRRATCDDIEKFAKMSHAVEETINRLIRESDNFTAYLIQQIKLRKNKILELQQENL